MNQSSYICRLQKNILYLLNVLYLSVHTPHNVIQLSVGHSLLFRFVFVSVD